MGYVRTAPTSSKRRVVPVALQSRGSGLGVIPIVAGIAAGQALVNLLGGTKRLSSGVSQKVYNDEVGDSRMQSVVAQGPAALAAYIANVMNAPGNTSWGTAYSPEAIVWARARLASMQGSTTPATAGVPMSADTTAAVNAVLQVLSPGTQLPTNTGLPAGGGMAPAAGFFESYKTPILLGGAALAAVLIVPRLLPGARHNPRRTHRRRNPRRRAHRR